MASIVLRLLLLTLYLVGVTRLSVSDDYPSTSKSDATEKGGNELQNSNYEGEWIVRISDNQTSYASTFAPFRLPSSACGDPENGNVLLQCADVPLQAPIGNELPLLFTVAFVITNALTVLDLALSRPTKPWRFLMRIIYRFGRANLKLSPLLLLLYVTPQFTALSDLAELTLGLVRFAINCKHVHYVTLTCQYHPKWLCIAFLAYAMLVRWTTLRFFVRPVVTTDNLVVSNPYDGASVTASENRYTNRWSAGMSRWWLLIECIFRPVSLATAHTLADFDLELDETMDLFFERLVFPNLWLTPAIPPDYVRYLPVWQTADDDFHPPPSDKMKWIPSNECAICLDKYRASVEVCGLPCGHHFHESCIMSWLERDNHHCPICRWPAYRNKHFDSPQYDLNQLPLVAA